MKNIIMIFLILLVIPCQISIASEIETIHFLIPSKPGGGWDTTARETARTLVKTGLIGNATFENIQGAGGYRAMLNFINKPDIYKNALMVQSTPLIFRNIMGIYKDSFRSLKPVCLLIGEYQVIAVDSKSPYKSVADIISSVKKDRVSAAIMGGSPKGSLDHITATLIMKAGGIKPGTLRYCGDKIGEDSLKYLMKGYGIALVTGYGEIADALKTGKVRVLGITSEKRLPGVDVPTFREQGLDVVFVNWRGFFARSDISDKHYNTYRNLLVEMSKSEAWQKVREKYAWSHFLKTDDSLIQFLEAQEKELRAIAESLELIKKDAFK